MGKTIRYVALSALLSAAGAASANDDTMNISGIEMSATSGTLELHRMTAKSAVLSDDSTRIVAGEMTFKAKAKKDMEMVASAPECVIVISGEHPPMVEPGSQMQLPGYDEAAKYADNFETAAFLGDMLLEGKGKGSQATAKMGDEGALFSDMIIWSERFRCLLLPKEFEQQGTLAGGSVITVTGAGLAVNREFTEWLYYSGAEKPLAMNYTRSGVPAGDKKGTVKP
ncbi:hypothetical protein BH09SUM1_BH09SUM1_05050 [soil metagenome]